MKHDKKSKITTIIENGLKKANKYKLLKNCKKFNFKFDRASSFVDWRFWKIELARMILNIKIITAATDTVRWVLQ